MTEPCLPDAPPTIGFLTTLQSKSLDARYPASISSPERCPTCKGTKTFRYFAPGTKDVVTWRCNCLAQYRTSRWLWHCGVLARYQRLGWSDVDRFNDVRAAEVLNDYINRVDVYADAGIGLVMTGPRGTGKTLLAHLVMKDIIAKGLDCYATSFTYMVEQFADGWKDRDQSRWFNQRIRDARLLLVDDLGRERNKVKEISEDEASRRAGKGVKVFSYSAVGDNMLETVLRHRVSCQLPTIVTSNLPLDRLAQAYGGHTESLLTECSIPVDIQGEDVRREVNTREVELARLGVVRPVTLS